MIPEAAAGSRSAWTENLPPWLAEMVGHVPELFFVPLAVCALAALLLLLIPALRRGWALVGLNLLTCLAIYRGALLGLAVSAAIAFAAATLLARYGGEGAPGRMRRWRASGVVILAVVAIFLVGRRLGWEATGVEVGTLTLLPYLLDMWLFLRLLSYLWEVGAGRVKEPRLLPFLQWIALPFAAYGPLIRYSELQPQIAADGSEKGPVETEDARPHLASLRGLGRIAAGLGQILLAGALTWVEKGIYSDGSPPLWQKLAVWFGTAPWAFYLAQSGYFKVMETLATSGGWTLPTSFHFPFGRKNLSEFWASWNMTVTRLIRDYLLYMRFGLARPNPYLNTLLVFLGVGLWHGANTYWVIWGLLHGVAFCAFIWYTQHLAKKVPTPPFPTYGLVGRVLTYLFVCSCWILPSRLAALIWG